MGHIAYFLCFSSRFSTDLGGGGNLKVGGGGSFKLSKFNFQDINLIQNFTAIPNPASDFGYNHLLRSNSALRNAMIKTLKMPKIAKLPRLNSANDAQIQKNSDLSKK